MRATLRDVAEAAGVSSMAVSVVLNGTGGNRVTVSPEKAEMIRETARKLRYRPNHVARSLRNRRTMQVAVVFQHFKHLGPENPFHIQVLNGVTSALFPAGYAMTLCPRLIVDGDAGSISDGRFDGVLWCRPDLAGASIEAIRVSTVPVVMVHAPPGTVPGLPTFCADNESAMHRVVDHLASLGHERIAFAIDPISVHTVEGHIRSRAFVSAALQKGLPEPEVLVLGLDHSMLLRYREPDAPHTALVCFSDELAGFLLESCRRYGVDVPGDISVVGFDSSPFCETTRPRLTSVNQPVDKMAHAATLHLLSMINEADAAPSRMACCLYDCGLDVRDSTAPPRVG